MVDAALVVGASVAGVFVLIIAALLLACCIYMQRHPMKQKRVTPIHQSTETIRRKAEKLKQKQVRKKQGCFFCCMGSRQQLDGVLDLPEPPHGLQLRRHGAVDVTFSWKPAVADTTAPGTTHFKVYKRRQRQLNGWRDVTVVPADDYEYQFEKTERDKKHVWGVSSKNKNGESRIIEIQPVSLNKVQHTLPLPPYGLELCEPEPRAITLKWKPTKEDRDAFPVTNYQLYFRKVVDKTGLEAAAIVKSNVLQYRFTKLVTGKKYVFGVSSKNKFGESTIVHTIPTKMNKKPVLPGRPTDLLVRDRQSNNLTLSWSAPRDDGNDRITKYHVMMRMGKASWEHVETLKAFDRDNYCKIEGLVPGFPYLFRVAADNSVGVGAYVITNELVLEAEAEPPHRPSGPLEYKKITHKSVTLSWQPPQHDGGAQVTGYAIEQLDERAGTWYHVGVCGGDKTRYTVTKISEDVDVRFRVIAMNSAGNSQPLLGNTTRTRLLTIPTFTRS